MSGGYETSPNAMLVASYKGYKTIEPALGGDNFSSGANLCSVQEQPNGDWYKSCVYISPMELHALANMISVAARDVKS